MCMSRVVSASRSIYRPEGVQILSLMAILFVIEPILFLLLLPVGIPYLLFQWRLSRRQFEEVDARVEKQRWIGYYSGVLSGEQQAAEIKLLGLAPLFIERCRALMEEFRELRANYQRFEFLGNLVFALFSVVAVYLAMSRAAFSIVDGRLTIGDLAIYASAAAQLRALVENSIALIVSLRWEILHIGNLRVFLALPPEATAACRRAADSARRRHRVSQRDVHLSWSHQADTRRTSRSPSSPEKPSASSETTAQARRRSLN